MPPSTYVPALHTASRLHQQLSNYEVPDGTRVGTIPAEPDIFRLIDAAFWASLRREEVYTPRISMAYVAPEQTKYSIRFTTPIALAPKDLTKVAAAVERSGLHLCIWPQGPNGELQAWGISRSLPPLCLLVEVILPGLLVAKVSPLQESGKFLNVAVLQGDDVKIIDPMASAAPHSTGLLSSLLRLESQFATGSVVNVLLQMAVSMRAHGRGGILLVVPPGSEDWKESMLQPMTYQVTPPFSGLGDLMRKDTGTPSRSWENAMARAVDGLAGLTAVDGATAITADYDLLAFGAKVVRRPGAQTVTTVVVTEPVEGGRPQYMEPAELGGTRHLAAAQFVHDQRDSIALVASQEGRFTVFAWSPVEGMVHCHRIDVLLM